MLDPFPPPPEWLRSAVEPWALWINLPSIPDHIHEVIFAFALYQFIHSFLSPWLSPILFPRSYPNFNRRTKLNWDVHVVSLVQSTLINSFALWVMFTDQERKEMGSGERVFGYTGACGLIQALATGYFVYDMIVSTVHFDIFGLGMLFHGFSALWVFGLGFVSTPLPSTTLLFFPFEMEEILMAISQRPFLNFYTPVFILYELSSPFLNIHWFLDKVNMTGGKAQWYNGMLLLFVFFSCRLVWGTWQSVHVYIDMWKALSQTWSASAVSSLDPVNINAQVFQTRDGALCIDETCARANAEVSKYSHYTAGGVPTWLVVTYIVSNLILNSLNYYWFSKMIETVLKRFRGPPPGAAAAAPPAAADKKKEEEKEEVKKKATLLQRENISQDVVLDAAAKLEQEQGTLFLGDEEKIASAVSKSVDEVRKRNVGPASKVPFPPS